MHFLNAPTALPQATDHRGHVSRRNKIPQSRHNLTNIGDSEISHSGIIYPLKLKRDSSATNYLRPTCHWFK